MSHLRRSLLARPSFDRSRMPSASHSSFNQCTMSTKTQKILFGILLILPIVAFTFGLMFTLGEVLDALGTVVRQRPSETGPMNSFLSTVLVNIGSGGLVLCAIIFPIHALLNARLDLQTRFVWVVVMVVGATLAHLPYYIVYILRNKAMAYALDQQPIKVAELPSTPR
jgi:hypothetical protein